MSVVPGPGKEESLTSRPGVGFTGVRTLRYDADAVSEQRERRATLYRLKQPVTASTRLSYVVLPADASGKASGNAQYVAVDLLFTDGTRLSSLKAMDQHRVLASAAAQGDSRVLHDNQWNALDIDVGAVAHGKTVAAIELVEDAPKGAEAFHGYIDDLRLADVAQASADAAPNTYVDTRRGSNANAHFSRGNNFPAVALPHGFNFWTPTTQAGSDWIYQYQDRNGADNHPRIQAFALSHEPSPWMGDRQTFQVMPAAAATGAPSLDRDARSLPFTHDHEIARADLYQVTFDNGITTAMTPTDHAAMMRFTFKGDRSQLVFDNRNDKGGVELDAAHGSISGYSDVASHLSTGATRLFFYATFDRPVTESGRLTGQGRDNVAAWFGFDTHADKTVTMRMATSLISLEQAKRNLAQEISSDDTFDSVQKRAAQQWNQLLGRIEIPGASARDKVTLYSNLYRLFLYPNEAYENVGTAEHPDYRYASPFSAATGASTPTQTGARVLAGKPYVNNGLWDTYRTAWPAYALLTPKQAGEMIDGFVQQYRDGGWIARWSSPGYADLMVGTSSDVAFADAWNKGIRNFDVRSFYQAALKDATVVSDVPGAGRKGIERSVFHGYVDNSTDEGLSWSMAGYLNDFGISELAQTLAGDHEAGDPYAAHYADDARYFRSRSLGYTNLFNADAGFFIGRKPDGSWRIDAAQFDPKAWGGDYTETNAWNMSFDGVHDGQGLANLYGGTEGLAKKLDAFFGAGTAFNVGAYGGIIHEMLEARDVRMGQYGHSNQPSHHILYMYDLAGQPWKTQDKVRDALSRLYVGSEIGQGYPGDEDNGEMSAWWVFSAAGFYPLRMGTPTYAIGAPYFPHMIIHLENGKTIDIRAPEVSDRNRYIQGVTLNGKAYDRSWLAHADLANGAVLDFRMGEKPSAWGSAEGEARLPSITTGNAAPAPLRDFADSDGAQVKVPGDAAAGRALSDNTSDTEATLRGSEATVQLDLKQPKQVALYTLTSSAQAGHDPKAWTFEGSSDGVHWVALDTRHDEAFPWRRQTRAFAVAHPGSYAHYRWRAEGAGASKGVALSEVEWLGQP
ncbi:GH92 family glycosyl hydrolase [Dyella telluris]|uniref:Glycoside hydrolase family 92 protein n=1 Tax=Dyella telluris TaxID=2763498 RepID=A0A7G8Q3W7_9GAMM|nr:GH92 family glycosyl hydrolase [Dyella telluris]QNK01475.1 glycoside hydrolase family 92 protein [Dyella telluris]